MQFSCQFDCKCDEVRCNLDEDDPKNRDDLENEEYSRLIFLWMEFPWKSLYIKPWYFQLCCIVQIIFGKKLFAVAFVIVNTYM